MEFVISKIWILMWTSSSCSTMQSLDCNVFMYYLLFIDLYDIYSSLGICLSLSATWLEIIRNWPQMVQKADFRSIASSYYTLLIKFTENFSSRSVWRQHILSAQTILRVVSWWYGNFYWNQLWVILFSKMKRSASKFTQTTLSPDMCELNPREKLPINKSCACEISIINIYHTSK